MTDDHARSNARLASTLFLTGAALLLLGNTTHPVDSDPSATSRLDLATGTMWIVVHLAIALGVIFVVGGFTALRGLITEPKAQGYARFGAATAVMGGTMLVIVFGALDGHGMSSLAADWNTANEVARVPIEAAAVALNASDSGITALGIVAFFGLTTAAFGRAILASTIVAAWLGWVALAIGLLGLVTGVVFAIEGPTSLTINILFRPVALSATAYFIVLGLGLRRVRPIAPRLRPPAAPAGRAAG